MNPRRHVYWRAGITRVAIITTLFVVGSVTTTASAVAADTHYAGDIFAHSSSSPGVDPYADAIAAGTTAVVINPGYALGAPDGQYAGVRTMVGARIVLDLGAGEEGLGDLTIYYQIGGLGADSGATVDFLDSNGSTVASAGVSLPAFLHLPHTATVHNSSPQPYRYVRISDYDPEDPLGLDAIKTATLAP